MYTSLVLFQQQINEYIPEKRQGRDNFFHISLRIGNKSPQSLQSKLSNKLRSPLLLSHPKIKRTSLIKNNKSIILNAIFVS